jgi:hypothetical protein
MREIGYVVRGFLTVRRDSLRVPLTGSLTVRADPDSGLFSGDLALRQSTVSRTVLGASLFSATVQIEAESVVIGRVDPQGRMFATVAVGMGRRLVEIIPYVPIATTLRTGIAIFTYCGTVTFGITSDFAANPDLDVLARGIESGLSELLVAAKRHHRRAAARERPVTTHP